MRSSPRDLPPTITMRLALRVVARQRAPRRIKHAKSPFWVAVRHALVTISEEIHAAV